jgi:hypothetical protein
VRRVRLTVRRGPLGAERRRLSEVAGTARFASIRPNLHPRNQAVDDREHQRGVHLDGDLATGARSALRVVGEDAAGAHLDQFLDAQLVVLERIQSLADEPQEAGMAVIEGSLRPAFDVRGVEHNGRCQVHHHSIEVLSDVSVQRCRCHIDCGHRISLTRGSFLQGDRPSGLRGTPALPLASEAVAQSLPRRATCSVSCKVRGRRNPATAALSGGPQATASAFSCRWSFKRLWVAAISRHSDRQADLPRRWKRPIRRLNFICAKTGSIVALRLT